MKSLQYILVHYLDRRITVHQGAKADFWPSRRWNLAYQKNIERRMQRVCDLIAYGDASSRKRKHHRLAFSQKRRCRCQLPSGIPAVLKTSLVHDGIL
jgi:hypothetical protein